MRSSTIPNKAKNILIILFWIGVWEVISLIVNREIYLPSPYAVLCSLSSLLERPETYLTIVYSSYRTLTGFCLSCLFGVIFGYAGGVSDFVRQLLTPLVSVMRAVPVMSIIIIALIWFKDTNVPVFVAILMCFPIMWTSTVEGVSSTDIRLIEVCKVYNVSRLRMAGSLYFPSALSHIKAGMVSSLGIAWKVTSAAEVMSLPKYSIGGHLYDAKVYLEIPELFAWTVIIIVLSFIFEMLLSSAMSKV